MPVHTRHDADFDFDFDTDNVINWMTHMLSSRCRLLRFAVNKNHSRISAVLLDLISCVPHSTSLLRIWRLSFCGTQLPIRTRTIECLTSSRLITTPTKNNRDCFVFLLVKIYDYARLEAINKDEFQLEDHLREN